MSLATIIPIELVNHILSFRPRHPVAELIRNYKIKVIRDYIEEFEDEDFEDEENIYDYLYGYTFYNLSIKVGIFNCYDINNMILVYDYNSIYNEYNIESNYSLCIYDRLDGRVTNPEIEDIKKRGNKVWNGEDWIYVKWCYWEERFMILIHWKENQKHIGTHIDGKTWNGQDWDTDEYNTDEETNQLQRYRPKKKVIKKKKHTKLDL
jgi:hypothetical protein